ncbi:MAG: putative heavy-metal binding protein [Chloroflexi bacterium]|nr:putative heavy-metal binding protein [Chloroflexota bacterium]MDB5077516.1 putative heavy-metal binding protein [Chloroflexota bacterium]
MFGRGHAQELTPEMTKGPAGHAATSDLTGQEFWLINDAGFQVLGLVLGNCVYSMGAMRNWLSNFKANFKGEIKEVTQLMYDARELALQRMQAEADALGADTVVGVDIKIEYMHNGEWMEVTATGTAVRRVGPPQNRAQVTIST